MEIEIEQYTKALETARWNKANYEEAAATQWDSTRRNGPIKYTESQLAALKNYDNNEALAASKLKASLDLKETLEKLRGTT